MKGKIGERMCDKKMKKRQNNKKRQSYKRDRMTLREQNPKDVFTLLELGRKKLIHSIRAEYIHLSAHRTTWPIHPHEATKDNQRIFIKG